MAIFLEDNFNDNSIDLTKWAIDNPNSAYDDSIGTLSETSQRIEITPPANTAVVNGKGLRSLTRRSFINRKVEVEVPQVTNQTGRHVELYVYVDDANILRIFAANTGNIAFRLRLAGVNDDVQLTYSNATHRFWRIRHNAATSQLFYETSTNGSSWTIRRTVNSFSLDISSVYVGIFAGTITSNSNPGTAHLDNFNFYDDTPHFIEGDLNAGISVNASVSGQAYGDAQRGDLNAGINFNASITLDKYAPPPGLNARIKAGARIAPRVILALSDALIVNARILPGVSASPFRNLTEKLLINGEEIGIKSYLVNKQAGAVGYEVEIELSDTSADARALLNNINSISFSLGTRATPTGAINWTEILNTDSLNSLGYRTSARGRSLRFSANNSLKDLLRRAPRGFVTLYDAGAASVDLSNIEPILTEAGAALPIQARAFSALSLYDVLNYALVEGAGFSGYLTNLPNYQIARADFSPFSTYLDSIRGFLGIFDPVIFEREGNIIILDTTQILPAGFEPLELTSAEFTEYAESARAAEEIDGFAVVFTDTTDQQGAQGANYYAERDLTPEVTEAGGAGEAYIKTTTTTRIREYFQTSEPARPTKTEIIKETSETVNFYNQLIGRETTEYNYDSARRPLGFTKTFEARLPDITDYSFDIENNKIAEVKLMETRRETQIITYTNNPYAPGEKYQSRIETRVEALLAVDSENPAINYTGAETDFLGNYEELYRSGNLNFEMSAIFAPLETTVEKFTPLKNGQVKITRSKYDALTRKFNNSVSVSEFRSGDISAPGNVNAETSSFRRVIFRAGASAADETGLKLAEFALGELPLVFGFPLAKRILARRNRSARAGSISISGFDLSIREGSTFKVLDRAGEALANVLILGYSITGESLGSRTERRISSRFEATEIF